MTDPFGAWLSAHDEALAACQAAAPASEWPAMLEIPTAWNRHVLSFAHALNRSGLRIAIAQIKQKGDLRIYYTMRRDPFDSMHPVVDALVEAANAACLSTCVDCGERGRPRLGPYWQRVSCEACQVEWEKARRANG